MIMQRLGAFTSVPLTASGGTTYPSGAVGLAMSTLPALVRSQKRWVLKIVATATGAYSAQVSALVAPTTDGSDWGYMGLGDGNINAALAIDDSATRIWYFGFEDLGLFARIAVLFSSATNVTWTAFVAPIAEGSSV